MKAEMEPAEEDPGLVDSLQNLSNDLIEYGDARLRLIRAEIEGAAGRLAKAVGLAFAAWVCGMVAYLAVVAYATALLSTQFGGSFLWPLLIVASAHFVIALILAAAAFRKWQAGSNSSRRENSIHP